MKKILSFIVASAMVASMAVTAFAAEYNSISGAAGLKTALESKEVLDKPFGAGASAIKENPTKPTDYVWINGTNSQKLAEGDGSVKVDLTESNIYKSLADFQKDYSFSYKVKSGPVKSVALKYDTAEYKSSANGSVPNDAYKKVQIEIKFNAIISTDVSTNYEVEVNIKDKKDKNNNIDDATISGALVVEAVKLDATLDEIDESFEGFGPVVDFGDLKNKVATYSFEFNNDDGDTVAQVDYKAVQSGKINFAYNVKPNAALSNKYADIDLEFVNFLAAPKLAKVADIKIYSENAKGGVFQVNSDGSIQDLRAKYNTSEGAYEFKSATLGSFFVASDASKIITAPVSSSSTAASSSAADGAKKNPGTGASDIVNVAVVMSVVSLAAAGAVAFKKASK